MRDSSIDLNPGSDQNQDQGPGHGLDICPDQYPGLGFILGLSLGLGQGPGSGIDHSPGQSPGLSPDQGTDNDSND